MKRELTRGVVRLIQPVHGLLSFVTLSSIDENWEEETIPFYLKLDDEYIGRVVDIIIERNGFWNSKFKQTIESEDLLEAIEMPYSSIKKINRDYRRINLH